MAARLICGLLVAYAVGAYAAPPNLDKVRHGTRTVSTLSACTVSNRVCSVSPIPSPGPFLQCGTHGSVMQPAPIGTVCRATTVPDCAAACFSSTTCKSFQYTRQQCTLYSAAVLMQRFKPDPSSNKAFYGRHCYTSAPCPPPGLPTFALEALDTIANGTFLQDILDQPDMTDYAVVSYVNNTNDVGMTIQIYQLDPTTGHVTSSNGADRLNINFYQNQAGGAATDYFIAQGGLNNTNPNIYPLICTIAAPQQSGSALSCTVPADLSSQYPTMSSYIITVQPKLGYFYYFLSDPATTTNIPVTLGAVNPPS